MGRLIDADALFTNGVFLVDEKNPMKSITELINRITNAPTAYDVEKVVAELTNMKKDHANNCHQVSVAICNRYSDCGVCLMDRTIDIVKAGGVE